MEYKNIFTNLDNNIKVLLVPVKNIKIVHLIFSFRIGSDLEQIKPKNTLEVTHFLEHMFSGLNSTKYPDYYKLKSKLVGLGITVDASVDYNTTKYQLLGLKTNLDLMLDVLYHAYNDFKIDTKYIEQERNAVKEEINNILNDTWIDFIENINKQLYPNHTRGLSQKLNLQNSNRIKVKDLMDLFYNH